MVKRLIALLPGDGIGPEVVAQGRRVLEFYRDERGLDFELWDLDLSANRFLRDGTTYPEDVAARIRDEASAVLLGAVGDPRAPIEYARDILFGLRFGLDLYANVRPVKALHDRLVPLIGYGAKDVDITIFRENTEGVYVNMGGNFKRGTPDEIAINEDLNTRKGVERLIVAGFEYAKKHATRWCTWPTSRTRCRTRTAFGTERSSRSPSAIRTSSPSTSTSTRSASTWCKTRRSSASS